MEASSSNLKPSDKTCPTPTAVTPTAVNNGYAASLQKHGIDFIDIPTLFEGETVTIPDERFDYGETRLIVIGIIKNQVIVVACTERDENIHIISARKATKNEQIYYFQQISD